MKFTAPRGTRDILPDESPRWQWLESCFREVCRRYGYREIRTPTFEDTELFARSAGEGSELVSKQMYTFADQAGRSNTLRPEGTPPVMRAFVEHQLASRGGTQKLFYIAAIFRYDRPQAGRYREHTQVGAEAIGPPGPDADAELLALYTDFLAALGIKGAVLQLNSIGDAQCRPRYVEALRKYYEPHLAGVCDFCRERYQSNPLRLLDCKRQHERGLVSDAPNVLEYLCDPCREHFDGLRRLLDELEVPYQVNPRIVRGLDYYTRTAFEVLHDKLGAQDAIAGGGRYDGLAEELGGPPTPAIGFGSGVERLLLAQEAEGVPPPKEEPPVYIAAASDSARTPALALALELRRAGLAVELDHQRRSLKAQMREAGKLGSRWVILLGDEELASGQVTVRDMQEATQTAVPRADLHSYLTKKEAS